MTSRAWDRIRTGVDVGTLAMCAWMLARGGLLDAPDQLAVMLTTVAFASAVAATLLRAASRAEGSGLGPLLLVLAAPGLVWSSSPRLAVVGFAMGSLVPAAAALVPPLRVNGLVRLAVAAVVAAAAATFVVLVLYRDPFHERICEPACVVNPLLRTNRPELVLGAEHLLAAATIAWLIAVLVSWRSTPRHRPALIEAACVVVAVTTWVVRLVAVPRSSIDDGAARWLGLVSLASFVACTMVSTADVLDVLAVRWRIRRFGDALAAGADRASIERYLRQTSGDGTVVVHLGSRAEHPLGPTSPTSSLAVVRRNEVVATIDHRPSSARRVAACLGPAVSLILETLLLVDRSTAQLEELERSRTLAVHSADEARRQLERDLHDGAQQQLLLAGMELVHAGGADGDGRSREAAALVTTALRDLRRLGRGDAAVIDELGLADAITAMSGGAGVSMVVDLGRCEGGHECWPTAVATVAYRLVNGSLASATRARASELSVTLRCSGPELGRFVSSRHDVGADATSVPSRALDHDRVVATGGRVLLDDGREFEAWLP